MEQNEFSPGGSPSDPTSYKQGKSLADLLSVHLFRFTSERTVNFRYSTTVRLYDCTTVLQYYSTRATAVLERNYV